MDSKIPTHPHIGTAIHTRRWAALLSCLLLSCILCGCASLQVPAIDPTGASIFAPSGSYTTLQSPCTSLFPTSTLPRPAFGNPPIVGPCATPVAAVPQVGTLPVQPRPTQFGAVANAPDRLLLTPSKIVAPVGSEVVLLAGLSGADGQFVARQPVEWLLSQESVGNFIDVGERDQSTLLSRLHHTPDRRDSNFAVARTSAVARTITRGTPALNDDIVLQRGQTWVTMTAASEGISHVTAVATDAGNWEQRRQTATIQWVDAQWVPPAPTVARAGESVVLTTAINRSSSRAPVRNWIVRYEVVSGPAAGFGIDRSPSIEVPTDPNGKAPASLQPLGREPGVTQIKFEILSPSLTGLDGEPVVVGQGITSVTWSAAGLAVRIDGPRSAAVGAILTYEIEVTNPGDLPADNVTVTAVIPETFKPLAQDGVMGRFATWTIDRLPPQGSKIVKIQCEPTTDANAYFSAEATANGVSSERVSFNTQITRSALRLDMEMVEVPGAPAITVGSRVSFNIQIENTSNEPLSNITLLDNHAIGLQEVTGQSNPVKKLFGSLAPGEVQQLALTFEVIQPGELWHKLEATADGGHTASVERSFRATAPRYDFSIALHGDKDVVAVDDKVTFDIVVTNTGDGELNGIRIIHSADDALNPTQATDGYKLEARSLVWAAGSLAPGKSTPAFKIECDAVAATEAAITTALVEASQGLTNSTRLSTAIRRADALGVAPPGPARPEPNPNSAPPRQPPVDVSPMQVTLTDINDPIVAGDTANYTVMIKNSTNVAQRNVGVSFQLPAGSKFSSLVRPNQIPVEPIISTDGREISMRQAIREVRPGEELTYQLYVELRQPGLAQVGVVVDVIQSGKPQATAVAETTVRAN